MTTSLRNTADSPIGPVPDVYECPHCGRPLKRIDVRCLGRSFQSLPCWGSCGCAESALDGTHLPARLNRYARIGIPPRFAALSVDVGDLPETVARGIWAYACGPNGTGKTTWAVSIVKSLLDLGLFVRFENAQSLLREELDEFDGAVSRACSCQALVLDDLGKENVTPWSVSAIYEIVDTRYREKRPTVFTSNFSRGQLASLYAKANRSTAEAIVSRLFDGTVEVDVSGRDRRLP